MGFWNNAWSAAKAIGKGVIDVFIGIGEVLILAIYAIGYVIFSIIEHLYNWIDGIIEKHRNKKINKTIMVPPAETEEFIKGLRDKGKTTLPPYKPGVKRTLLVAEDSGTVVVGQVASTERGFDDNIEEAFKKGYLVEQPIEQC